MKRSVLALSVLAACTSITKERGHDEVGALVKQRTGFSTGWNQGTPEDAEVARTVDALLKAGLTRDGAVQIALVNNPELQATYEELGVAQAELVQAGLLSNPRISASLDAPIRSPLSLIEVGIVQNFLDLFMLPLRKQVAAEQFAVEVSRVAHAALGTTAEVSRTFYEVQAATQKVELQALIAEAARAGAETAERQKKAGNINALEHASQAANDAQARVELLREQAALVVHREHLNRLLGLYGAQTQWSLAAPLAEVPADEPQLEKLETRAVRDRLDLRAARGAVALLTTASNLVRTSAATGFIDIGAEIHQDPNGPLVLGPTLSLELPIFDRRQAQIAKVEAQARQAERRLRQLAIDARSEVRAAFALLQASRQEAVFYKERLLPLREQVLEQTQLQYNAMQLGVFQLLDAKNTQSHAYRDYLDAVARYWSARAELERALGGTLNGGSDEAAQGQPR
ncbi:MAG: TolC family protein [Myxococcaceae bacterium]|nr:TolC family protein [Myxococcaceae bacterium]